MRNISQVKSEIMSDKLKFFDDTQLCILAFKTNDLNEIALIKHDLFF